MNGSGRKPAAVPRSPLFGPLIAVNAGVLIVLLCGPNGMHPNVPVAVTGAFCALAGVAAGIRALILQRRDTGQTP